MPPAGPTAALRTTAISVATFLASFNTSVILANKTVVFVNDDNVNGINLGGATLNIGANTVLAGFGNGATIMVPGGVQPLNVIGTFTAGRRQLHRCRRRAPRSSPQARAPSRCHR